MQPPPRAYVSATSGRATETASMLRTASFTTIQQFLRARCTKLAWPKPLLVLQPPPPLTPFGAIPPALVLSTTRACVCMGACISRVLHQLSEPFSARHALFLCVCSIVLHREISRSSVISCTLPWNSWMPPSQHHTISIHACMRSLSKHKKNALLHQVFFDLLFPCFFSRAASRILAGLLLCRACTYLCITCRKYSGRYISSAVFAWLKNLCVLFGIL
jgi:hypothetical protein